MPPRGDFRLEARPIADELAIATASSEPPTAAPYPCDALQRERDARRIASESTVLRCTCDRGVLEDALVDERRDAPELPPAMPSTTP